MALAFLDFGQFGRAGWFCQLSEVITKQVVDNAASH
jgi:hypothetical protein